MGHGCSLIGRQVYGAFIATLVTVAKDYVHRANMKPFGVILVALVFFIYGSFVNIYRCLEL